MLNSVVPIHKFEYSVTSTLNRQMYHMADMLAFGNNFYNFFAKVFWMGSQKLNYKTSTYIINCFKKFRKIVFSIVKTISIRIYILSQKCNFLVATFHKFFTLANNFIHRS